MLQRTSDSLKGPQRASEGLMGSLGAYLFLVFFSFHHFFHFSPTGFESDTILSPTPRDFPGSPGSPFSYPDGDGWAHLKKKTSVFKLEKQKRLPADILLLRRD